MEHKIYVFVPVTQIVIEGQVSFVSIKNEDCPILSDTPDRAKKELIEQLQIEGGVGLLHCYYKDGENYTICPHFKSANNIMVACKLNKNE